MGIAGRTKVINIPKYSIARDYRGNIDGEKAWMWAWASLLVIVAAALTLALTYAAVVRITRKPGPPPKVIYKTVYRDAMTAAQQAYINQCKDASSSYGSAVPDVHGAQWTCTFVKNE